MSSIMPALIMGFREGLEAFLVLVLAMQYLATLGQSGLKREVFRGAFIGVLASVVFGFFLMVLSGFLGGADKLAKIWESLASFIALGLVTLFIIWMIRYGRSMTKVVRDEVDRGLSVAGIFWMSFVIVAREGTEITIFTFAGKYAIGPVLAGVGCALVLAILVYYSLVRVNMGIVFRVTLAYLILQAGYLLGYAVHEGLSALKAYELIAEDHFFLKKVFDVSGGIWSHKMGVIGVPLNIVFGWYSKPEWAQFLVQVSYVLGLFLFWRLDDSKKEEKG